MKRKDLISSLGDTIDIQNQIERKREMIKQGKFKTLQVAAHPKRIDKLRKMDSLLLNFGLKLTTSQLINLCIERCNLDTSLEMDARRVMADDRRRGLKDPDKFEVEVQKALDAQKLFEPQITNETSQNDSPTTS